MADYLPRRDVPLLHFMQNFALQISGDPEALGLTQQQSVAYADACERFAAAMQRIENPMESSRSRIVAKNVARDEATALTRTLVRYVRAAQVADAQLAELRLRPLKRATDRVPATDCETRVDVRSVSGRTVMVLIRAAGVLREGWPEGVVGAAIYAQIKDGLEPDPTLWQFHSNTSRPRTGVYFQGLFPVGTKVWITAAFLNPRLQPGRCGPGVAARLQEEMYQPSMARQAA